jgi:hypothetical protein
MTSFLCVSVLSFVKWGINSIYIKGWLKGLKEIQYVRKCKGLAVVSGTLEKFSKP